MAQGIRSNRGEIKYIPTDTIKIYLVQESELDELERGSQSDLFLEFGIALLSFATSFLISLLTVPFPAGSIAFVIFVIIASVTFITGVGAMLLWYRQRRSKKGIIRRIREHEKYLDSSTQ